MMTEQRLRSINFKLIFKTGRERVGQLSIRCRVNDRTIAKGLNCPLEIKFVAEFLRSIKHKISNDNSLISL